MHSKVSVGRVGVGLSESVREEMKVVDFCQRMMCNMRILEDSVEEAVVDVLLDMPLFLIGDLHKLHTDFVAIEMGDFADPDDFSDHGEGLVKGRQSEIDLKPRIDWEKIHCAEADPSGTQIFHQRILRGSHLPRIMQWNSAPDTFIGPSVSKGTGV